ncbi:MAG: glycosyltransferase family 39 protein [Bacteroidetes bacterium]|nr:glycosyltransferase family 39 protein [Bacteroidota bacterium]
METMPASSPQTVSRVRVSAGMLAMLIGAAAVLLHALVAVFTPYGIFRDELYYIACSKRLAFGYVDHPPLSIVTLFVARNLLGDSMFAIRLVAALLSGLTTWLTGMIALRMGGSRFAVAIACLAAMLTPISIAMHSVYSMNALDHFFWTLGAWLFLPLVEMTKEGEPSLETSVRQKYWWLLLGLLIGLGSMNKIGMLWFAAGIAVAVLFTPLRRQLRTPWPWVAAGIAVLLFLPYVLWNAANDFAHLEFIRNATTMKYGGISRLGFLRDLFLEVNPLYVPLFLIGLWYLFLHPKGKAFRALGMVFLVAFAILFLNGHSKAEYLSPTFPMIFAAAGVWLESVSQRRPSVLRPVLVVWVVAAGLLLLPFAAPVLPAAAFVKYTDLLGVSHPNSESRNLDVLPQFFADMHGWEDFAKTISKVYLSLPEKERRDAVVFARNYGQAGAIEYYADRYPAPRVIAVHNNYWLWGYPEQIGTVIVIGGEEKTHRASCDEAVEAAVFRSSYVMPYENNQTIWICRGLRRSIKVIWKEEKVYI